MATNTPVRAPRKSAGGKLAKFAKAEPRPQVNREKRVVSKGNAISQKALVYGVRTSKPPAISDEAAEEMPFSTDGQ